MRAWIIASLCVACGGRSVPSASASRPSEPPSSVERVSIEDQEAHWGDCVELVPPVRLPTAHPGENRIEVFARFPEDGRIAVEWLDAQQRWTLSMPPGAVLDRVESLEYGGGGWTVADVRGSVMSAAGIADHVYRPADGEPEARLLGFRWLRGDADAAAEATARLVELVSDRPIPVRRGPMDAEAISRLRRFNDCGHCHRPNMPHETEDRGNLPHRSTDADGFFVPLSLLAPAVPISEARPVDLNAEDPYVEVACEDGSAPQRDGESLGCGDGSVPLARRDVERGMREGDAYTQRVCESRRRLHARMDERGRRAFAEAFAACGL